MAKVREKTRALEVVGYSIIRRLETAILKHSAALLPFRQLPSAGTEHIRDKVASVVRSESTEELSVVLHVGTNAQRPSPALGPSFAS